MKLDQSVVQSRLALCAAALAGTASAVSSANAAIVTFTTPLTVPNPFSGAIPQTTAGVYINLTTGATGTSAGAVSGWDFNPYAASGGTQLGFYWAPSPAGGVASTTTGPYLDLSGGGVVGPSSVITRAILGTTGSPFLTAGTHILGFAFVNEAAGGATDFGYITIQNLGPNTTGGFDSTIRGWSFDNTGAAITVPALPAPAAALPLTMAALALGGRRSRPSRQIIA